LWPDSGPFAADYAPNVLQGVHKKDCPGQNYGRIRADEVLPVFIRVIGVIRGRNKHNHEKHKNSRNKGRTREQPTAN